MSVSRGWHRRGYLPHLDVAGRQIGVTFRLHDSVPARLIGRWRIELAGEDDESRRTELLRKIAAYEDAGRGACWLHRPDCAESVVSVLRYHDGTRYRLTDWCVMPNHVHVLVALMRDTSLESTVRGWKSFTAREMNRRLERTGRVWAPDYFDRLIRNGDHLTRARRYIRTNPVKAGLCARPEDWRWSSARA